MCKHYFRQREGSGPNSGSTPLTNGSVSGSGRPKSIRILRLRFRIRIPNTAANCLLYFFIVNIIRLQKKSFSGQHLLPWRDSSASWCPLRCSTCRAILSFGVVLPAPWCVFLQLSNTEALTWTTFSTFQQFTEK